MTKANGAYGAHGASEPLKLLSFRGLRGLIVLVGLIVCLVSCSSESAGTIIEEPEQQKPPQVETGTAIAFAADEQQEEEKVTRANTTSLQDKGVSTFKVWGFKNTTYNNGVYDADASNLQTVFPGYIVNWRIGSIATTPTNTDGWEYVNQQTGNNPEQSIKYWDWSAKAYRYFGVATTTNGATYEANETNGVKTYEFTFPADCSGTGDTNEAIAASQAANMAATPYYSHLWFSTGNPYDYPNQQFGKPVQLEFLKPFARVRFMFTYSYQSEGIKIRSTEFMPTGDYDKADNEKIKIATAGTFKVIYPLTGTKTSEWFDTSNFSKFIYKFDKEYIPEGGPDREIWYTVLPRTSQGSYTMYVKMNNDTQPKTAVVPAEYMTWLPGFSYTYIFKITEEGGVAIDLVQSAVTPWTDMEEEHPVYNW